MDIYEHETPWIRRVEELIKAIDGSTIGELELYEAGTEIIIRRSPDTVMVPLQQVNTAHSGASGSGARQQAPVREDRSQAVATPMTGVYYASPSPSSPPFVNLGEMVHVGQIVALVEAMKVFNEIQSEIAGRVVALAAKNGEVVQKGEALLKIEAL